MTDFRYSINASELNYNWLSDYICLSNIDVLSFWCIVLIVEFMIIILNLFTLRWIQ